MIAYKSIHKSHAHLLHHYTRMHEGTFHELHVLILQRTVFWKDADHLFYFTLDY